MTALLRCRGALSEIAAHFGAEPARALAWRPESWHGEQVLVVKNVESEPMLDTMIWGLPPARFMGPVRNRSGHGTIFPRELRHDAGLLDDPGSLEPCLIVLEAFAYPDGPPGLRSRAWAGLWDHPIAGWAGMCDVSDGATPGCAGLLVASSPPIARVSRCMPLLVHPDGFGAWLDGSATLLSLSAITDEEEFYLERTDERWSTGSSIDGGS